MQKHLFIFEFIRTSDALQLSHSLIFINVNIF
jgi:hypothetical protein